MKKSFGRESLGFALPQLIIIIAIAAAVGGYVYFEKGKVPAMTACTAEAKMCPDGSAVGRSGPNCEFAACPGEDTMMHDERGTMLYDGEGHTAEEMWWVGELLSGTPDASPLLVFNQTDYDAAIQDGKLVVLFFYANWCPICKAEFPRMVDAFNELSDPNVVGFRVNYKDDETDASEEALARTFGVAYQHTKVFVFGGTQLKKSPESYATKEEYLSRIGDVLSQI